jgi:nicotinamide riboside transporter PnuC
MQSTKGIVMVEGQLVSALQVLGWILTLLGQVQVARKRRAGFVTWIVANIVLIGLSARVGLWWSIGMYLTNIAVCAWSFRAWAQAEEGRMRTLFVGRRTAW